MKKWNSDSLPLITFELCHPGAICPSPGNDLASGLDIYTPVDFVVPARSKICLKTGVKAHLPSGYDAKLEPRSGTSWKNSIEVGAGRIDTDYRKEIGVVLYNHSDVDHLFKKHERIAQMIIQKVNYMRIQVGQVLDETERGGFGSTGR